jgi:hypothetical protein
LSDIEKKRVFISHKVFVTIEKDDLNYIQDIIIPFYRDALTRFLKTSCDTHEAVEDYKEKIRICDYISMILNKCVTDPYDLKNKDKAGIEK